MTIFDMSGSSWDTLELEGTTYDGSQNEIRIDVNSPFFYGPYFFVGGVRYNLDEETRTELVYRAQR